MNLLKKKKKATEKLFQAAVVLSRVSKIFRLFCLIMQQICPEKIRILRNSLN